MKLLNYNNLISLNKFLFFDKIFNSVLQLNKYFFNLIPFMIFISFDNNIILNGFFFNLCISYFLIIITILPIFLLVFSFIFVNMIVITSNIIIYMINLYRLVKIQIIVNKWLKFKKELPSELSLLINNYLK